jgi:hypothetical protein
MLSRYVLAVFFFSSEEKLFTLSGLQLCLYVCVYITFSVSSVCMYVCIYIYIYMAIVTYRDMAVLKPHLHHV